MSDTNDSRSAQTQSLSPMLIGVSAVGIVVVILIIVFALRGSSPDPERNVGEFCSEITVDDWDDRPDLGGCTLRVAVENAYIPFNFIADNGEAEGYDYDVFADICERLNCRPEFVELSWDTMLEVMAGEREFETFDIGADGITITVERGEFVDFSEPYIQLSQIVLIRTDETRFEDAQTLAAVFDARVGSQTGTTNYEAAVEIVGEDRVTAYDQFEQAVDALIAGEIDAVVMDNVAGLGYVAAHPDQVIISGQPLTSEELGFILSKGSPLTAAVNAALAEMETDGTLEQLFGKWFVDESS